MRVLSACLASAGAFLLLVRAALAAEPTQVEFNRDVRLILADHCFQCHGPDAKQRQAELRLDVESAEPKVVIAGDPDNSELIKRVTSTDPDERMPPAEKGRKLTEKEVATLKQWIAGGAKWQKHWSLLPVTRPAVPPQTSLAPARGPLDAFILDRLQKDRLSLAPEADRPVLLRRASLALTGLPPAIDEIDAFLADRSPDAYERVVDRLLASPRYGERMATPWLDAARYADTSGYQSDGERHMWRWRDWVIDALNGNMPFDQFTIEQLAGDLLPQPTLAQRIATGFNRNHRGNAEGGIIPEEYAVEYVADRVETTTTVWLGLTLGCARCHDHKYDPLSQRDFYSLFAFFNNVPEHGRAIKLGNSPPFIKAPTPRQQEELSGFQQQAVLAEAEFASLDEGDLFLAIDRWEQSCAQDSLGNWYPTDHLVAHLPLDGEAAALAGSASYVSGVLSRAAAFDGQSTLSAGNVGDFGFLSKFSFSSWVFVPEGGGGTIVSRMADVLQGEGYQLAVVDNKLQLNLVKRWLDDALRIETADRLSTGQWHHVAATYDGSRLASGVKFYIDGQPVKLNVLLDELNQTFTTKEPLRLGAGGGPEMRFRGSIDELRIYSDVLNDEAVEILATRQSLDQIVATSAGKRTAGQSLKLRQYYIEHHASPRIQSVHRARLAAGKQVADYEERLPTVMVMEEMPTPRPAHILIRGQYDKPGERVTPNVPAELPPLTAGLPRNRLGMAKWLVDPANPLTSRVTVNRVWQTHFGVGLVKTAEDFGRQGEWPSHPELLDWLAAEFMHGWDQKRIHRVILSSHTFRQSSRAAAPHSADPDNRLLSRGPRLRLPAEMVRDQALLASGRLVEQLGGPSVKPLQPPGLWSELTGGDDYQPGKGADLVRRSLYTFWKRTIPPPSLATFDAPTREFCSVRDSRTNTPLQALALLNEEIYVAAARALSDRVMREANSPDERIARAMMLVIGRPPTDDERRVLLNALQRYRERSATPDNESAAYALVCSTILNLDEAVTRQ